MASPSTLQHAVGAPLVAGGAQQPILRVGVWVRFKHRLPFRLRPMLSMLEDYFYARRGFPVWLDNTLVRFAVDAAPVPSTSADHVEEREMMSRVFGSLNPGDLFLDVGSHVGLYAIGGAMRVGEQGHVIAFEPTPRTVEKLTRNVRLNQLAERVDIHECALSDAESVVDFVTTGTSMMNSIFTGVPPGMHRPSVPEQRLSVRTARLDTFLDQGRRTVAKIDAEGHEIAILRGARKLLESDARIFMELHPWAWGGTAGDWEELQTLCRESGREIQLLNGTVLDRPAHLRTELVRSRSLEARRPRPRTKDSMAPLAIRGENLGKRYRLGVQTQRYRTLRETLSGLVSPASWKAAVSRSQDSHMWALRDVCLEVAPGEVLGIIGRNGSGKSTMLKVLSRITEPTSGFAEVRGRVGALLEVGTGFHNELTGRENIFLSGAILGMKRTEIRRKFDQIVEFAEVSKFVDTPLKHYSTGMYLRLAFGVAAHLEPSILMVDEVLAVGDMAFQAKCLGKMQEVGKTGRTVLFVSHDLTAIARLAPRTLLMQNGQISFDGPTEEAIREYVMQNTTQGEDLKSRKDRAGDGVIRMESLRMCDAQGQPAISIGSGDPVTLAVTYSSALENIRSEDFVLDVRFTDVLSHPITTFSTRFSPCQGVATRQGTLVCHIPSLALASESYAIDLWLKYRGGLADGVLKAGEIQVVASRYFETGQQPVKQTHGAALFKHHWRAYPELSVSELSGIAKNPDIPDQLSDAHLLPV